MDLNVCLLICLCGYHRSESVLIQKKTEVFHFHLPNFPKSGIVKYVWWGNSRLPVCDPIFTYPGHTIAGSRYKGKARDALFASL